MRKDWRLTQEAFDKFLSWFHPDREEAGKKYEDIRRHLIIIFTCRGCPDAEELADETIDRVIRRAQEIADSYEGDPAYYFITVAHRLFSEGNSKRQKRAEMPPDLPQPPQPDAEDDRAYDCLDKCIQKLSSGNRDLVLKYYQEDKQAKIDHRKEIADEIGIAVNALRIRAHRIRGQLKKCIEHCLINNAGNEMD